MKLMDQNRVDKITKMAIERFKCRYCKILMNVMAYRETKIYSNEEVFKAVARCEKCGTIFEITSIIAKSNFNEIIAE